MNYTGKIISLAFPDTFVRFSDEEKKSTSLLQFFGLGKGGVIKAGHAAFVLIENETGVAEYYDFGRYITPPGKGRVRSAETDVELEIPFKATFTQDGKLFNVDQFLLWLEAHPEKTHGSGRLVASVCDYIYYDKAKEYVLEIQNKGSIPYSTFRKEGSNCSRIVTDTILQSTDNSRIRTPLLRNKLFTPSPLGNVEKGSMENKIYQVEDGNLIEYPNSVFVENLTNYFDKKAPNFVQKEKSKLPAFLMQASFLSGIGSGAYFTVRESSEASLFEIRRYTDYGEEDFRGVFRAQSTFNYQLEYRFVFDSHCKYCHIEQEGKVVRFDLVKRLNSVQKER
ncbi:hypothetical protein SAMN04487910_1576 [Aquimarina amphilecti]|uniref:Uncharacterized protein n=1 Tax=Aquimarina amphilecti TaxID=1038014 RepID=A0A1H7M347_AQUAM|nr:DUF6695 family protein [Aquimarina amphilecti]SEL05532.1 hypothetical protein SAMN04487910_1576 [Aquimarina amphilecti]